METIGDLIEEAIKKYIAEQSEESRKKIVRELLFSGSQ